MYHIIERDLPPIYPHFYPQGTVSNCLVEKKGAYLSVLHFLIGS